MKRENEKLYFLLIGVSIYMHLFVFLDFRSLSQHWNYPEVWHLQSYALIIFSLLLSILLVILEKFRLFLIIIKFFTIIILGYPLGEFINIETILIITIILETIYYLPDFLGAILSVFFIMITFFNQKEVTSWGISSEKPSTNQLFFFIILSFFILFISLYLKNILKRIVDSEFNVNRLDYAVKELTDINLDFQNYAASIEHDAIENERKRISREMHDIIGYTLTNQLMIIQAIISMKKKLPSEIENLLLQSQKQTKDGMEQARSALYKLRAFTPESEVGLKLIFKLVKTFEQITGIRIKMNFTNTPNSMGLEIDKIVYRLVQESLTNAFRHGKSTDISINMSWYKNNIIINIWDNGKGASKINEGIGLKGMRERLDSINGYFESITLNSGFTIRAKIPYINPKEELLDEHTTSR